MPQHASYNRLACSRSVRLSRHEVEEAEAAYTTGLAKEPGSTVMQQELERVHRGG